jgi:hypothetical protein
MGDGLPRYLDEYIKSHQCDESSVALVRAVFPTYEEEFYIWFGKFHEAQGIANEESNKVFESIVQALGLNSVCESLCPLVECIQRIISSDAPDALAAVKKTHDEDLAAEYCTKLSSISDDLKPKILAKSAEEVVLNLIRFKILEWSPKKNVLLKKYEKLHLLYYIRVNRIRLGIKKDEEFYSNIFKIFEVVSDIDILNLTKLLLKADVLDQEKLKEVQNILGDVGFTFYGDSEDVSDHTFLQRCSAAMSMDYIDNCGVVETFSRHIRECVDLHRLVNNREKYFAPYTTVLQSSGKGKTHLLHRYAKDQLLLYISLGDLKSNCFPPGNQFALEKLARIKDYKQMFLFLGRIYLLFLRQASELIKKEEFKNAHTDADTRKKFLEEFLRIQDSFNGGSEEFYSLLSSLPNDAKTLIATLKAELQAWDSSEYGKVFRHLTVVFDEARALLKDDITDEKLSLFRLFRRALRELNLAIEEKTRIFAVLLDTSSRVSNFTPAARSDISQKNSKVAPLKLHAPFIHITNKDIPFFEKRKVGDKFTDTEFFEKVNFFKIGRPIWLIDLNADDTENDAKVRAVFALAKKKLLGGMSDGDFTSGVNLKGVSIEDVKLALLSIRTPLAIARYGRLAESMPASHMRTIRSLSDSREVIYSAYNREPVLACAAASLSLSVPEFSHVELLDTLLNLVITGLVSVGDQGEQLLAYVYILARDILADDINGSKPSHPLIKVKDLLKLIHGEACKTLTDNATNRSQNLEMLLNGEVSFCQFIDIENTPDIRQVKEGFYGGTGFISRPNQAGVDIYIPVRIRLTEDSPNFQCSFEKDVSKAACRGSFPNADDILKAKSRLVPTDKRNKVEAKTLYTLSDALNFCVSDVIKEESEYLYSAICIQSKNTDRDNSKDNKGIDLRFSGVIPGNEPNIPCISIKHVLRFQPKRPGDQVKAMKYDDRPYRHGIVIRGLDHSTMLTPLSERKAFFKKMSAILSVRANENVHNSTLDLKLQSAADHSESFRVTPRLTRKFVKSARSMGEGSVGPIEVDHQVDAPQGTAAPMDIADGDQANAPQSTAAPMDTADDDQVDAPQGTAAPMDNADGDQVDGCEPGRKRQKTSLN